MKKTIMIAVTGIVLICCVLISAFSHSPAQRQTEPPQAYSGEQEYTLSVQSGRISVFRSGEDKPFLVTDTFADSLPKADRNNLEKGVKVSGEKELQKALEDYCS